MERGHRYQGSRSRRGTGDPLALGSRIYKAAGDLVHWADLVGRTYRNVTRAITPTGTLISLT